MIKRLLNLFRNKKYFVISFAGLTIKGHKVQIGIESVSAYSILDLTPLYYLRNIEEKYCLKNAVVIGIYEINKRQFEIFEANKSKIYKESMNRR